MNEFRFIYALLILYERVLKILSVTERHSFSSQFLNWKSWLNQMKT